MSRDVILGRRQLYILPTYHGWLFALMLVVLLLASINYGNGLGYGLTFLLGAVAVVTMLHTHRNLLRLRVASGSTAPVFAGDTAEFALALTNDSAYPRYGVCLEHDKKEIAHVNILPGSTARVALPVPARRRGWMETPPFTVTTRFPLGILYSWSRRLTLPARCLVYPAPAAPAPRHTLEAESAGEGEHESARGPGDDFIGQREYRPGDSPRHINWKALARGQGWYTKEFGGAATAAVWLDWDTLPALDTEARLSMLCRWLLDAEQAGLMYGLRLPGVVIEPAAGEAHQNRCLEALALYPG